ncbi:hypothetical protein MIR68_011125 [Amoeboaphelidium protococcarum]|nr:hypothetical protein MIR68_011125 [Amoeboaphelidium protococcarum]
MIAEEGVNKVIGVSTEIKRTGTSVPVESDDGKPRYLALFEWKVNVHESSKRKGRRGQIEKYVEKVEFKLHPTFTDPVRFVDQLPFELREQGYGSFDLEIVLHFKDGLHEPFSITHPIMLDKGSYEQHYDFVAKDAKTEFVDLLKQSVPQQVVSAATSAANNNDKQKLDTTSGGASEPAEKKRRVSRTVAAAPASSGSAASATAASSQKVKSVGNASSQSHQHQNHHAPQHQNGKIIEKSSTIDPVDMLFGLDVDKLADALYGLQGNAIMSAVEIVKKHRQNSTYIHEDPSEFHFDLYTLPREGVIELWNFCTSQGGQQS